MSGRERVYILLCKLQGTNLSQDQDRIAPRVDADGPATAHNHHPSTLLQHLDVVPEVDVGEVLDDDVEAGAEMLHHLLVVVLVVVIEHVVRPTLACSKSVTDNPIYNSYLGDHVHALLGAGRADHHRAERPRDLDRGRAHRPASTVH